MNAPHPVQTLAQRRAIAAYTSAQRGADAALGGDRTRPTGLSPHRVPSVEVASRPGGECGLVSGGDRPPAGQEGAEMTAGPGSASEILGRRPCPGSGSSPEWWPQP